MAINLKAKETLIQVGDLKGTYRFVLVTEIYGKLSAAKVIKEAALRSGISRGVMQACWDAAGEVIKAWATEGISPLQRPHYFTSSYTYLFSKKVILLSFCRR